MRLTPVNVPQFHFHDDMVYSLSMVSFACICSIVVAIHWRTFGVSVLR